MIRNFMFLILFIIFSSYVTQVENAKILGIFHAPSKSHYILGNALLTALVKKGHEVTIISCFKQKSPMKNYRDVIIEGFIEETDEFKKQMVTNLNVPVIFQMMQVVALTKLMGERPLQSVEVKNLLKSNEKFDLVIMEIFMNEAYMGFAHHYDAPVVLLSSLSSNQWVNYYTKIPEPSSYCPHVFGNLNKRMNFLERVQNTLFSGFLTLLFRLVQLPAQEELLKEYFPGSPELSEIVRQRLSVTLMNSHPSFSHAKPLVPNTIEIGGFHIEDPKPLPKDLKEYLDNAKEGFILFSLGSNIKGTLLPQEKTEIFLKTFEKLPYKILWKFEDENLAGKPPNVKISSWLPQNDILTHPNLKLFITHGGLLSTTEAIYHGVPIVGIPLGADQKSNMATSERSGFGKNVDINTMDCETFLNAINEVINNKFYRENVQNRSKIMRDRPMKPLDEAVYWVEYALRHKSADHLKTGAMYLKWYEEMLLDVIAFLAVITFVIMYIFYIFIKKLWNCCRKNKKLSSIKSSIKNKKNN